MFIDRSIVRRQSDDRYSLFTNDSAFFDQFTCEAITLPKMANLLAARNYKIVLQEEQFIPHVYAHLSDADLERAEALYAKLEAFDEVTKLHDNIA